MLTVNPKETFAVGTVVYLQKDPSTISYIRKRKDYLAIQPYNFGLVVRHASTGKIGIDFQFPIFFKDAEHPNDPPKSSMNQGCHGAGRLHHCLYLPSEFLCVDEAD